MALPERMTINGKTYGRLVPEQIKGILAEYADIEFPEHFERRLLVFQQPSFYITIWATVV